MTTYPRLAGRGGVVNVAHRGASGHAPENTLAAYELAVEQGADVIEVDVTVSRDAQVVLLHDGTLERTTDAPRRFPARAPWRVQDFTADELAGLSAGSYRGRPQRLPTLGDALAMARRHDVGLLLDSKRRPGAAALEPAVAAALAAVGDDAWVRERVAVGAFRLDALLAMRAHVPGIALAFILDFLVADRSGLLLAARPDDGLPGLRVGESRLDDLRRLLAAHDVGFLGVGLLGLRGELADDFTAEDVSAMRAGGVELNLFANDAAAMGRYLRCGVSSILTDYPDRLSGLLARG